MVGGFDCPSFARYDACMKTKKNIIILLGVIAALGLSFLAWNMFFSNRAASPDTNLQANTPPQIDPKTIGKVVRDAASGKDFISNQLIVEFNTSVSEEEALAAIAAVGGKMEQRFTAVPLFLVRVEDNGDGSVTRAAVKKLIADQRVVRADMNFLTTKPVDNGSAQ